MCENSSISIRSKLLQNCIFTTAPCRLALYHENNEKASDPPALTIGGLIPNTSDG